MNRGDAESLVPPAVDTLPLNVAILDETGTIVYTNDRWREFGEENDIDYRPDTIGVNYLEVTGPSDGDAAETAHEGIEAVLAGERDLFEFEYPCHSPEERRWFLVRAAGFEEDGERYVAVAHSDVTERREYRRRLRESNERLEQFASAVSHDLREPMRNVVNCLHLLERRYADRLGDDASDLVETAMDGARRMTAMVDGLLEYSRVERRGDPFEPVDLDAVLADVTSDLAVRLEETDAEVVVGSLPVVEGDRSQLRQLFQNLLDNAVEYSGDAPPRIEITAERASDGEAWTIAVSDEGVGIDPAEQAEVFEVFERGSSSGSDDGTGLGLALCERIVDRHGGEIDVESEPGEGATFLVTLPAATEESGERPAEADGREDPAH